MDDSRNNCPKQAAQREPSRVLADVDCKLFADLVTKHVCTIRKKELNLRGIFSCAGCKWEKKTWNECS